MKKIIFYFNHALKKILIQRFYKKYVVKSKLIQQDIEQTFKVRQCKAQYESLEQKFKHLMVYYPEFAFVFFWRIKKASNVSKKIFAREYMCKIFGSTNIKGGLTCFHPFSTVINAKSIGENFEFRNNLTIGNKNNDNSLLPIIGNNVTLGANVVIIGDITIGSNVVIGAGAVVVKDIPSNCVVAGNPAKIIKTINE